MKRSISMSILTASLSSILVVAFQNCSSGKLPDLQNQTAASTQPDPVRVALIPGPFSAAMVVSTTQQLSVLNAIGTATFVVSSGTSCSVTPAGFVSSNSVVPANAVCTITVTDSGGNLPAAISITVNALPSSGPSVTSGTQSFDASTTFVVPAFATLTVEVYGAGAGGSDYYYETVAQNRAKGSDGQRSSVTVNGVTLVAEGGKAGNARYYENSGYAAPGAGGAASGGSDNQTGSPAGTGTGGSAAGPNGGAGGGVINEVFNKNGSAPGGGGTSPVQTAGGLGTIGSAGGGGGGGYTKYVYTPAAVTQNLSLTLNVGKGGTGGDQNAVSLPQFKMTGDGANGRIVLTWN